MVHDVTVGLLVKFEHLQLIIRDTKPIYVAI